MSAMPIGRWAGVLLLCLSMLGSLQAAASLNGTDEQLDALLSAFNDAKSRDKGAALDAIAASGRDDTRAVLEGLLDGDLMYLKSTGQIVWVDKGASGTAMNYARTETVEIARKRDLKKLSINNSLRSQLRLLIAGLGLRSADVDERRSASRALLENPTSIDAAQLGVLLDTETDAEVQDTLQRVAALQNVSAEDAEVRLAAVAVLGEDLSLHARQAIATLAGDENESVQRAALRAQASQEGRLVLYGWLETAFFGLSLGSVLVLAAIGLSITFGVMGVINMAHGELIMLGAYCTWALQQVLPGQLTLALLLAIPVAFVVSGLVGIAIERGVVRFLYGRPLETLLATFGISLILQQAVRTFVSPQNVPVSNPAFMSGVWEVNSAFSVTMNRLVILLFCLALFVVLQMLLKRSRLGVEVRAVAQNRAMARALGVRSARVDAMTFGLGAGIAGIAGVALSQLTNVGPNLGQAYIVDSFMVVVFGGVGNLWGTLVGGMTLGVINKFLEPWAGAILAKIVVLVFLILFIQRRPGGLFPQRGRAAEALA